MRNYYKTNSLMKKEVPHHKDAAFGAALGRANVASITVGGFSSAHIFALESAANDASMTLNDFCLSVILRHVMEVEGKSGDKSGEGRRG
jgi:hypothetical protein